MKRINKLFSFIPVFLLILLFTAQLIAQEKVKIALWGDSGRTKTMRAKILLISY